MLAVNGRAALDQRYYEALRQEQERRRRGLNDVVALYREDHYRFVTEGLRECQGNSWEMWRIVLKAAYGKPLNEHELELFRQVAERDPPSRRVKELWLIIGRRGGKDSIASMILAAAAVYADQGVALRPGERILVPCFATNKQQAGIVFRYTRGYFETKPALARLVQGRLPDSYASPISLKNRVDIQVFANNFRAPRGFPIGSAVFDECAFWRSEDSTTPDVETYNAVLPGTGTVPNAMIVAISSAYRQAGMLYQKWKDYHGSKGTDDILVIRAPTATFHPDFDRSVMERMMVQDPEAAAAEYLSEWRKDLQDYVPREVVEQCVVAGRHELPFQRGLYYRGFVDPSGGTSDGFTACVAHKDPVTGRAVIDCLRERRPPFSPEDVAEEFATMFKSYGITQITGDNYAGEWPKEQFRKNGVTYEPSELTKVEIYRECISILTTGNIELLDILRLIIQISSLERRVSRGGRDSIDHPPGAHDDLANAALGAARLVLDPEDQGMVIPAAVLARARSPGLRR